MADETNMQTPRIKNEINWNTLLQILTVLGVVIGPAIVWGSTSERIANQGERASAMSALLDAHTGTLNTHTTQIENVTYRVTVLEQGQTNLAAAVEELKSLVNNQATELRVIRTILDRVEAKIDDRGQ